MACLQAGTVLSATVEQVLQNCLLVYVKHRSKIFRGVLFDEKNAVVWRTSLHEQTSLESMKDKNSGGSGVGDGAVRWSTRQASLFYRRQNNKSYPCRRIPSSFGGVKVLTDADLIKEGRESSENMVEKLNPSTKRPSASCDQKSKQGLVIKSKETSRRKTSLSSQVDVKRSKFVTNLKRKSSNQDSGSRPSKRKPDTVHVTVVSKGVQKNANKKQTKLDCKRPQKTEVSDSSAKSVESKDSTAKSVSSTHYKVLMTRPCSVPVVPVATVSNAGQRQHGTVLVLKKVPPPTNKEMDRVLSSESLESFVPLTDGNLNKRADDQDDQSQEIHSEAEVNAANSSKSLISLMPLTDENVGKGADDQDDQSQEIHSDAEVNAANSSKSLVSLMPLTNENVNNSSDNKDLNHEKQPDVKVNQETREDEIEDETTSETTVPIKEESVSQTLTDDLPSSSDDIVSGDTCNTSPQRDDEFQGESEMKGENENSSVSSDSGERTERDSKPENVTIKRSARISERKANTCTVQSQLKSSQKLGVKKSHVESNEVKMVGSDYSQADTASKILNHDTSNQPENESGKREMSGAILTQQYPLKHKRTTKYTQRMSWRLQPQVAPVDKVNMVSVGDIVWGKVHGHPWWPGRVLAISGIRNEESSNPWDRDAHVSWFGSNTSSIMRVHGLQLFLPNFAKRHKRDKKGFYRVAVRQAQEALQAMPAN